MNLDENPTVEQLRELVRDCDDFAGHHVLWVNNNGDVDISQISDEQSPLEFEEAHPTMKLRFPTFLAGNEYVGQDAAKDDEWIAELYQRLQEKWTVAKGKGVVEYADNF